MSDFSPPTFSLIFTSEMNSLHTLFLRRQTTAGYWWEGENSPLSRSWSELTVTTHYPGSWSLHYRSQYTCHMSHFTWLMSHVTQINIKMLTWWSLCHCTTNNSCLVSGTDQTGYPELRQFLVCILLPACDCWRDKDMEMDWESVCLVGDMICCLLSTEVCTDLASLPPIACCLLACLHVSVHSAMRITRHPHDTRVLSNPSAFVSST